jgi:hypothetical protein
MDKRYIIERQGKQFVLYEGLLDQAHQEGLCRISTTLLQAPHPDNDNTAIVSAEVETGQGVFSGIGDANSGNVGRPIAPHIIRMAETRAKARAMRDAVNIGVTSLEEMIDSNQDQHDDRDDDPPPAKKDNKPASTTTNDPKRGLLASASQLNAIEKLASLLGRPENADPDQTSKEASTRIEDLSREHNERKGTVGRART